MQKSQIELLRVLSTPFENLRRDSEACFSRALYRFAFVNKVVLSYLSKCEEFVTTKLYAYHRSRLEVLMGVLCRVCHVLDKYDITYAVFKTLRPFDEDVADIDIICLADDDAEYKGLVKALSNAGYVIMEENSYCTTLMDARYRYVTELMIDVYKEVSVGPLIYLNKKLFLNHVVTKNVRGCDVRILDSAAELLAIISHSLIKEMEIKLLDYLTALHLIYALSVDSIADFINLVRRARLVYGARLFLSVAACLHKLAYGFIPSKIEELLNILGGAIDVKDIVIYGEPPYKLGLLMLTRIYMEKLRDPVFKQSMARGLKWFFSTRSLTRLVSVLKQSLG